MDKAINRQRVLLQHLQPSSSSISDGSDLILSSVVSLGTMLPTRGALALGMTSSLSRARCVSTLLHEMKRRGKDCRFGVVSMCIGSGMGAAAVFERGDTADELTNARKVQSHNLLSNNAM